MNRNMFWELIEKYSSVKDQDEKNEYIINELSLMSDNDIFTFKMIEDEYLDKLHNDNLWKKLKCVTVGKFISDDGFEDFKGWVISQGEKVTNDIIKDNINISKYIDKNTPYEGFMNEIMLYITHYAYDKKYNIDSEDSFYDLYDEFYKKQKLN